jgi:hypothetical protein
MTEERRKLIENMNEFLHEEYKNNPLFLWTFMRRYNLT